MNEDWDGTDWAKSFSGPDDHEIEKMRAQGYQAQLSDRDEEDQYAASNVEKIRKYGGFNALISRDIEHRRNPLDGNGLDYESDERFDSESKDNLSLALIASLQRNDKLSALQLLERPVSVNLRGVSGSSAIMIAAYRGYADVCEALLSQGASFQTEISMSDAGESDGRSDTVMQRALSSQDWPTIEVITKAYVAAEWKWMKDNMPHSDLPHWGYPRLVEAARYGMSSLCVDMIENGVDTKGDEFGDEPPIEAAFSNDKFSTCFVLVAMGADHSHLRRVEGYSDEFDAAFAGVRAALQPKNI
jgi:ankyrin repeat protein